MLIAHGAIGYLTNEIIQKKKLQKLNTSQHIFMVIVSILFGILPDFDIFVLLALSKPYFLHHQIVSHTPLFWIIVFILLNITYNLIYKHLNKQIQKFLSPEFTKILLYTILIVTLFHLFADLTTGYIQLLYPFSQNAFTLLLSPVNVFAGSRLHPIFAVEILIVIIFILSFVNMFFDIKKHHIKLIKIFLIIISSVYLLFTILISSQIYNANHLKVDENNIPIFDQDYDGLIDSKDADIDNNGLDNIEDAETDKILNAITKLSTQKKLTVSSDIENSSLGEQLLYLYGAHDSYRLIKEVYIEIGNPIDPVINTNYSYSTRPNKPEDLYKYLKAQNNLITLSSLCNSSSLTPGKILFFMNNNQVINLGITTKDNLILTSLNLTNIRVYGLKEVLKELDVIDSIQIQK